MLNPDSSSFNIKMLWLIESNALDRSISAVVTYLLCSFRYLKISVL